MTAGALSLQSRLSDLNIGIMSAYKDSGGNSSVVFVGNIVIDNRSVYKKVQHNKKTRLKSLERG
jgi:hypothetical protein